MRQTMSLLAVTVIGIFISFGCSKDDNGKNQKSTEVKPTDLKARSSEAPEQLPEVTLKGTPESTKSCEAAVQPPATPAGKPVEPKGITLKEYWKGLDLPEVVATVGDNKITKEDLYKEIENQTPPSMKGQSFSPQVFAQISEKLPSVVDIMISRQILLDKAAAAGIKPSSKALEARVDKWLKEMPAEQKKMFAEQLKAQGSSIEKYRKDAIDNVGSQEAEAIDKWITEKLIPTLKVDDKTVDKYYRENQEKFKKPETMKVAHILIAPERASAEKFQKMTNEERAAFAKNADEKAATKAKKILAELKQGADFAKLAKENSICPSKAENGVLPEFDKTGAMVGSGGRGGKMVKPFTDASFKLKSGDVSDVVKTQFGSHIIKALEHSKESYIPFESVKGYLKETLEKEKLSKKMKSIIDAEKEKLKVKVLIKAKGKKVPEATIK